MSAADLYGPCPRCGVNVDPAGHDCPSPAPEPEPCPECRAGKHIPNCDGTTWDTVRDEPAPCPCAEAGHEPVPR